jgi:hypothetical protein
MYFVKFRAALRGKVVILETHLRRGYDVATQGLPSFG